MFSKATKEQKDSQNDLPQIDAILYTFMLQSPEILTRECKYVYVRVWFTYTVL